MARGAGAALSPQSGVSGPLALVVSLVVLAVTLGVATVRPTEWAEAAASAVGAALLLGLGAISASSAAHALRSLAPTVGFLAALLLIAEGCRREGLFDAIGDLLAHRCRGQSRRLLALVFVVASAVTIVLGLDATVVLLPPVVLVTAARLRSNPRGPLYACAHLANSASLLLPVSNLTNLLAFRSSQLSFVHFAGLMVLPTAGAIGIEWLVLSGRFAPKRPRPDAGGVPPGERVRPLPRYPLIVLGLALAGFALSSPLDVAPVWVAVAGAIALNLKGLTTERARPQQLVRAAEPGFLIFVLGLGVIVAAAGQHGLSTAVGDLLPSGASLPDLLAIAAVAAVLANLVNNLPATLILVPVAAALGPGSILAVLIGVDIGPNLTPVGSLATLLWRRVLSVAGIEVPGPEFVRLGLLTVPAAIIVSTVLLWVGLQA